MITLKIKKILYLGLISSFIISPIFVGINKKNNRNLVLNKNNNRNLRKKGNLDIDLGVGHSSLIVDGTLYIWGWNKYGQIGNGKTGSDFNKLSPTKIDINGDGKAGNEQVKKVRLGQYFSFASIENGSNQKLYSWGRNQKCQLGDGTINDRNRPTPIDVDNDGIFGNEKIVDISLGGYTSSVLLDNGNGTNSLYLWGQNNAGQVGDGTAKNKCAPTPIDVDGDGTIGNEKIIDFDLGTYHSSAIVDNGNGTQTLYMWGANDYGQLGDGTQIDKKIPTPIDVDGDGTKSDEKLLSVSLGDYVSSVILDNGDNTNTLYVWGQNMFGQLGNGVDGRPEWTIETKPIKIDVDNNGVFGDEKIKKFAFGSYHSSAIVDNEKGTQTLYMWGNNSSGQLGNGTNSKTENKEFNYETLPISIDVDGDGEIGDEKIVNISLGGYSSGAILKDSNGNNKFYFWGNNQYGQLGNGTTNFSNVPILIYIPNKNLSKYLYMFLLVILILLFLILILIFWRKSRNII